MNKQDLINAVAEDTGLTKKQAEHAVNAVLVGISAGLKKGDEVTLVGFGTFSVAKRAARTGRNPQTGAEIKIKASQVPKFKPGKVLKDAVA